MAKIGVFLADGFEEIEALAVVDLLRRAEVDTTMVAVSDTIEIIGGHGIVVTADKVIEEISFEDADLLFLPGGTMGVKNLGKSEELCNKLVEFYEKGKMVAAICAAPTLLHKLGILNGKNATCYRSLAGELTEATYVDANVVVDGNVITSQGFGTSVDMGLALIEYFKGREEAKRIQYEVMYRA